VRTLAPYDRSSFPSLIIDLHIRHATTGVRRRDIKDSSRSRRRTTGNDEVPSHRLAHRGVHATVDTLLGHRRGSWEVQRRRTLFVLSVRKTIRWKDDRIGSTVRKVSRTHRFKLGLSTPTREGLTEPKRCALDRLCWVPPRQVFHMRQEVRGASRDIKELVRGGKGS
jgi:hypothetical protein